MESCAPILLTVIALQPVANLHASVKDVYKRQHLSYLLFFDKATWILLIVTLLAMPPFGKIKRTKEPSNVML